MVVARHNCKKPFLLQLMVIIMLRGNFMDMWPDVIKTIERLRLSRERVLSVEYFNRMLGICLEKIKEGPSFATWSGVIPDGPFSDVLLKMAHNRRFVILALDIHPNEIVTENKAAISSFGKMSFDEIIPGVPPEGVHQQTYELKGARVTLAFTTRSRRLMNVVMNWKD